MVSFGLDNNALGRWSLYSPSWSGDTRYFTSTEATFSPLTFLAMDAALEAGALLRDGFGSQFEIREKEGRHNLVTEYDHRSEECLFRFFRRYAPGSRFLAEESGHVDGEGNGPLWIVDPLDGTVNFAHQIPFFSVSIGLEIGGEIRAGVVYHPMLHELFVAEKGKGAFLNGKLLSVSSTSSLVESMFAVGFPYNLHENPDRCIRPFLSMLKLGFPIRRMGSAALDLCYTAAGRFDGFFEVALSPWDCAAGALILEEAGGKVTHWDGKEFDLYSKNSILATNGHLHQEAAGILGANLPCN